MEKNPSPFEQGKASYQRWREKLLADPKMQTIYEEEAAKKELWLQLWLLAIACRYAPGCSW